jgi:hypothetical protein
MLVVTAAALLIVTAVFTIGLAEAQSKPLPLSLECSACEVTAREIYYGYVNRSKNDKFHGTELEMIEVLEAACRRLYKYRMSQEAFGAHLKVFADPVVRYDVQNVEPVDYYSKKEEEALQGAVGQLVLRCQHYVGRFEDELLELITRRAPENEIRRFMCLEQTDICTDERLTPYKAKQTKRRKKWKPRHQRKALMDKWADEVNEERDAREDTLPELGAPEQQPRTDGPARIEAP